MALDIMLGQILLYILKRRSMNFRLLLCIALTFKVTNTVRDVGFEEIVGVSWVFCKVD